MGVAATALVALKAKVKETAMGTRRVTGLDLVMGLGMVKASGTALELVRVQVTASAKAMEMVTVKVMVREAFLS